MNLDEVLAELIKTMNEHTSKALPDDCRELDAWFRSGMLFAFGLCIGTISKIKEVYGDD